MAATATASTGPRYAPEDPTLPKPWRGLVDGKTGYLYFWNPETNVTQYERPGGSVVQSKPSSAPISSSVQVQHPSRHGYSPSRDDDKYGRGGNPDPGARSYQYLRGGIGQSQNMPNETASGASARGSGASTGGSGMSAEAYRRKHEITVTGDQVPTPLTLFEATGFPSEILKEMRYSLLKGANVVRCAGLS